MKLWVDDVRPAPQSYMVVRKTPYHFYVSFLIFYKKYVIIYM